jgi:hypothetical protein
MAATDLRGFLWVMLSVLGPLLVTVAIYVLVPLPWSPLAAFGWSAALFAYTTFPLYHQYRRLKRQEQGDAQVLARLSRTRSVLRTAEAARVAVTVTVLSINQAVAAAAGLALGYWAIRRGRDD